MAGRRAVVAGGMGGSFWRRDGYCGMVRSFWRRAVFYGLMVGLVLAAVEGMARVAYWAAYGEGINGSREEVAEFYERWRYGGAVQTGPMKHPFYGPSAPPIFFHELNELPPRGRREDLVLIGLTGGSVAWDVLPSLRRAVNEFFAAEGLRRRPVVAGLGYIGWRQPHQAVTAANVMALGGDFDVVVNVDGWNEAVAPLVVRELGVHPFYPSGWLEQRGLEPEGLLLVGRIRDLREELADLERAGVESWRRHTAVFGLVNRLRRERTAAGIVELNRRLTALERRYGLARQGPAAGWGEDAAAEEAARVWYRGSRLLGELADLAGAEYYHFLQPSQYVAGAKPLTERELARAYLVGGHGELFYRPGYRRLVREGARLRQDGVNWFDLTFVFAENGETLYRDKCCHLYERGYDLLAEEMVRLMGPGLRRAGGRPAGQGHWAAGAGSVDGLEERVLLLEGGDFRVFRRGKDWLEYVREDCAGADLGAWFFLHIWPADLGDLPAERRKYGFENRDFQFENLGNRLGDGCWAEQRLPGYAVEGLRTGQFDGAGRELWGVEWGNGFNMD